MRMLKVNSEIQKLVSKIIDTELVNSNITGLITVQYVDTYADFSHSKIYISIMDSKNKEKTLESLNKAKGFIRTRIAKELNFKKTPSVEFLLDDVIERGERIDHLIDQVSKEMNDNNNNNNNDNNDNNNNGN